MRIGRTARAFRFAAPESLPCAPCALTSWGECEAILQLLPYPEAAQSLCRLRHVLDQPVTRFSRPIILSIRFILPQSLRIPAVSSLPVFHPAEPQLGRRLVVQGPHRASFVSTIPATSPNRFACAVSITGRLPEFRRPSSCCKHAAGSLPAGRPPPEPSADGQARSASSRFHSISWLDDFSKISLAPIKLARMQSVFTRSIDSQ